MKIAVLGAGAVGCYYGGMMARAGHQVSLVGRANHVAAIQRDGLRVQTARFDERVTAHASTDIAAIEGAQLVLFCVKSPDTESAAAQMAPHLAPDCLVLTLQNGVDNAERVRPLVTQPVSAAVVYVATEMAGPGHVLHHGRGELVIEPAHGAQAAAQALIDAGIPVQISDNVRGALWTKLIVNCSYNAISALSYLPYGVMVKGAGVVRLMNDIVAECVAVAQADGVNLPPDIEAFVRSVAGTIPGQYSSTAQDIARGKKTEIDHLNGLIVRRGEVLDVPTPVNHALVRLLESKQPSPTQPSPQPA